MKFLSTLVLVTIFLVGSAFNPYSEVPSVNIENLDGTTVDLKDYVGNGKITVLSFWATWCSPCQRELDAYMEVYPEWKEMGVDIVAITTDNSRSLPKVRRIIETKGWKFTMLADSKSNISNVLGFQSIPQTYLVNQKGEIVYSHAGYLPGDECELENKIIGLLGE